MYHGLVHNRDTGSRRHTGLTEPTNSAAQPTPVSAKKQTLLELFRSPRFVYTAIFVAAFASYVSRGYEGLSSPPEPGDSHDYDAIAYNLWKGRGYGYSWSDPGYRAPYEGHARYSRLLGRQSEYYPTAYRPPALPIVLSGIYAITDRNFAAWRILNCAIVAGAVTLAAAIAWHFAGLLAAPLCAWLLLQHGPLTRYALMFMTEGIAAFLVTLLAYYWLANSTRRWTAGTAARVGLLLGALMTTRSIFVLWIGLAIFVPPVQDGSGRRRPWLGKAVCVFCAMMVIGPWWMRNLLVTGAFMPTGTQAPLNLPAGFGPRALMYKGLWRSNPGDGVEELRAQNVNPFSLEYEVRLAKIRSRIALTWMREHPRDVLRLLGLHVWQEIRPRGRFWLDWLLPAGCVALALFRKRPGVGILALMVGVQLLSVALTWGAGGRFMVPVHPLMVAMVSAAVVAALVRGGGVAMTRFRRAPQPA